MKVCIAEKPSVAKEIAFVIGAKSRRDGYYEGNGYQVTWTFGHFCQLWPPEDYKPQWKKWDLNSLPMLPDRFESKLMKDSGVRKQFKVVKSLFAKAKVVINCGDAGTEGELIQRWVIKEAKYKGPVQRLWISSLTAEAIKKGMQQLQPASKYDNLYYAASSRAIGDWLLGMNATRLYTLKYGGYKQLLSIGRVQTPTLAMLVDRHHEIEQFKPEPYWELQTVYKETTFAYEKGRFTTVADGQALLDQVTEKDLHIKDISRKEGKEYAPKLFDLTALQVYCNNRFSMTADSTLKTVQKLYEMKVVSYPRVDTTYLPNDIYPKVPQILKGLTGYSKYTAPLAGSKLRKSKKVFDDSKVTDHHAIIPTGEEKQLGGNEQKVYDIIVRRFLAVFYPDCKVAKTQVTAEVAEIKFIAKGKEILALGWRVLFPKREKSKEEQKDGEANEGILPAFTIGEHGPHNPQLTEKLTKAPNYYTEASLLRAMETAGKQVDDEELRDLMKANGIGRPSTRANIIETLFRRKYTKRNKKQVLPTAMGIELIGTIKNDLLKSAELTGLWEKKLKEIELGAYNPKVFIGEMKNMVDELVIEVRMESASKRLTQMPVRTPSQPRKPSSKAKRSSGKVAPMQCPKCSKGTIVKGKTRYGCTAYQTGCDFAVPFVFLGKKLSDNQVKRLVEKGATVKLTGFKKEGQKIDGKIVLNAQKHLLFEASGATPVAAAASTGIPKCPTCKEGTLIKGKTAYGCSRWKAGCDFRYTYENIRQQAAGRKLTKELVLKILSENQ